jgi:hypothetical protein
MQLLDRNFERHGHARFQFCAIDVNPLHFAFQCAFLANLHYIEIILYF